MRRKPGYAHDKQRGGFIRSVELLSRNVPSFEEYPFSIPALRDLGTLELHPNVTFLVGENGSGKSTLVEAIAVSAGFNAEGGSKNFRFTTRASESTLHEHIRLVRGAGRERDGYFLRAESFFNVISDIEDMDDDVKHELIFSQPEKIMDSYGGVSLHERSHGEAFLALASKRFGGQGLYILDEPEAAVSPTRQLTLLTIIHRLAREEGSQFIIATHSPILMAYPNALIYRLDETGIAPVEYEDTEHFQITRDFLNGREPFFRHLLANAEQKPSSAQ